MLVNLAIEHIHLLSCPESMQGEGRGTMAARDRKKSRGGERYHGSKE
jgi:hypothetical protein